MRSSILRFFVVVVANAACVAVCRADIFIVDFSAPGSGPSAGRRYRETDAGLVCTAPSNGETTQGTAIGPDGNICFSVNDVGFGGIHRANALTGAVLPDLVTDGQDGYRIPNGLAFIGNSAFSTSQLFVSTGVSGVIRFDATTGAYLGNPIGVGDHGLGTPSDVYRAPNNDLLVTDGARINRYNASTGAFINTFIASASGFGLATFGPDGNFYVCASGGVDRYDGTTGAFIGNFLSGVPATSLTFGNDGNLYAMTRQTSPPLAFVKRYNGTSGAFIDTYLSLFAGDQNPFYLITAPNTPEPTGAAMVLALATFVSRRRR